MSFKFALFIILALSILCFVLVFVDKKRAIDGKYRIKESRLFLISFFGGALGCLVGMYIFRHKTKKQSFTVIIPIFLFVHIVLLIFLFLKDYVNIL